MRRIDLVRSFGWVALMALPAMWSLQPARAAEGPLPPTNLRCEYLKNPLGIDVLQPRFAWVLAHTERGQKQTAYQVLVASSLELLNQDKGDLWDSGKTASEDSAQVVYSGKPLASAKTCYWKARYWDSAGNVSPYSLVARFEMGLLTREEWKGQWIGRDNLLRKEFTLSGKVVGARAYVTALGYYELRINGEKVGCNVLDPAWTTYPVRILYSTYDITAQLRPGKNAFGAMLGGGWATLGAGEVPAPYKQPALLLQVNIDLADGKTVTVASDNSWKVTKGPIVSDRVWDGETYDARRELPGWDLPGFDDSAWSAAQTVEGSKGTLSAQMMPPIRVVDSMVPVALTSPRPGMYVYDLGQNFSGWAVLHVLGPRGTEVRLRFSELLYDDGMVNRENIREAKSRDIYILRGEGMETYEPHFTYHGFRYVEVTGYPGTPSLDSLRGRVVHTAVEPTGNFAASKALLNQIHKVIRWSDLTNLHSVPTDCDQRNERMGWLGDAQTSAEGMMLNFDMAAFFTNFLRDMRDVQGADGTLTDTVPHRYGSRPADPAWGTAYPLICWYMYEQYGDRRILEENYEGLKKYVEFLRSRAPDNVLRYSYYGDWVAIEKTPGELVSDFYYYYDTLLLSKIAAVLGNSADSASYAALATQVKDAFNHEFFDAKTGNYAGGTQTANALPLFLDMVPKDRRGSVTWNLTDNILYRHDTHLTTGFIGVRYLMPLLTELNRSDLAYDLAVQTTYPSWGYMIANGATTLWELWQNKAGPSMNSHDHHMMGSVDAWFYRALAGIKVEAENAGYRHFRIEPQVVRDLAWASATVGTVRGNVTSSWTHTPGVVTLEVDVPVNSTASVSIPKDLEMTQATVREGDRTVWENNHFVEGTPGIRGAKYENGRVAFEVGSGHYAFRLTGQ
ncbi:MAG: glycoside hydrolase family 78 protein [Acidobacteriia bacterium]|nr:glycoside hydrolase family 78 protein [Terriglobia bacterium]